MSGSNSDNKPDYPRRFAQSAFPYFAPVHKMSPGGASVPINRAYDVEPFIEMNNEPYLPGTPSVQEQATNAWDAAHKDLQNQFLNAVPGTPAAHQLYQQWMAARATAPPDANLARVQRRDVYEANVPGDVQAMQQGMTYGPGPVRGRANLLPQYQQLGATRPLGPGEYIDRGNGNYSSEETITVPYHGKWAVLPSLWLVQGQPMTLDEDTAVQYAQQSGLNWPMFNSEAEANAFADQREQRWNQLPQGRTDLQPPLWSRRFP